MSANARLRKILTSMFERSIKAIRKFDAEKFQQQRCGWLLICFECQCGNMKRVYSFTG